MNRREVLTGTAALLVMAAASNAAGAEMGDEHAHHHHSGGKSGPLAKSAAECVQTGQVCLNHCLELLGEGDKAMGGCAMSVNQMLAVCGALQQLAAQDSKYLPSYAKIAMDVCKDCQDECRKHEKDHAECKACGEACDACYKECKKIAA